MKVMYWNTNKLSEFNVFRDLLIDYDPAILFLSEANNEFINGGEREFGVLGYRYAENPGCERIRIIHKNEITIELGIQNKYYSCIVVSGIVLISVHFPSQMYHSMDALRHNLRKFRDTIDREIGISSERAIAIIGDVNVNPYEPAMINFDGFMATNSTRARSSITSIDEKREPYYNPSWRLYVNNSFPGTKKYQRPSGSSFDIIEYHLLDQVLLSLKMKDSIDRDTIDIIVSTSNFTLLDEKSNNVRHSDHLPLLYEFKLKENDLEKV